MVARFTIEPAAKAEKTNARKRRIANELTKATDCAFLVKFVPEISYSKEAILPHKLRESLGHLFKVTINGQTSTTDALCTTAWLDDRHEGDVKEQLVKHLRDLAEAYTELADEVVESDLGQ